MKIVFLAEVKARFSSYVEACEESPVVVTKNGRPKAVLVAAGNEEELEKLILAHTPRFMAMLNAAERRIRKGHGIKHRDFWKAIDKQR
ncbi:MAG: type II toxin-antitoxin system Phd/YefM family antitoxin [Deltaproteobacteria bacterium]|nr:type II toxin-antitoxin system Phd/YefM family antitoxin [Deltaproteobacteria bacterium]